MERKFQSPMVKPLGLNQTFKLKQMRTDIELLELLKEHTIKCHALCSNLHGVEFCFDDPNLIPISRTTCGGGLCFVAAALRDTEKINDDELRTLNQLIIYTKSLAMDIDGFTGRESAWYFPYGEIKPRLKYIDLIIEKIKTNETK